MCERMSMEKQYDVAIVGGSCAGATAAYVLARAGRRVVIIDKATFPRRKLCGGMITEKTVRLLKRLHQDIDSEAYVDSVYSSFGLFEASMGKICTYSHPTKQLHFVDRVVFDEFLLRRAIEAGCEVRYGETVNRVGSNSVITNSGSEISAEFIVGADGANSVVRSSLVSGRGRRGFSVAVEVDAKYEEVSCFDDGGEVYPRIYFNYINSGYGWVFPKHDVVTIGLGGPVHENERPVRRLFEIFLRVVSKEAPSLLKRTAAFPVPFQNFIAKPSRDNIFLTGDAAGLVEPVTGEGIYFAILSGMFVAESVISGRDCCQRYNLLVRTKIHPLLRQARLAKRIYFNRCVLRYAMHKMQRNAKYCKYYVDLLSGDIDYIDYIVAVLKDRNNYGEHL